MRGRMANMKVDFNGLCVAIAFWVVAVIVTFVHQSDRFGRSNASRPHLRAAFYTAVWSIPFALIAALFIVLLELVFGV